MANWNNPTVVSLYTDVLTELAAKDTDSATMFFSAPTNQPEKSVRLNRTGYIFEESIGGVWTARQIGLAGGGTGAANAADARTNLGLASMAIQAASNVAITGGVMSGVAITNNTLTGGTIVNAAISGGTLASAALSAISSLAMAGNITFDADGTRNIGATAQQVNNIWIKNGAKAPVGADKWIAA